MPWLGTDVASLPPKALAARILCDRHNGALSGLDKIAVRLFNSLDEKDAKKSSDKILYLFNGHDIERWLLKVLCGLVFSGNIMLDRPCAADLPRQWLEILFGQNSFAKEQGLYICREIGHKFAGPQGIEMRLISNQKRISGIGITICGYELILSMSGFPNRRFNDRTFAFRPFELYTVGPRFEKSVIFTWKDKADMGTIRMDV